ncbi:hypothetical protein G6F65_021842 [Rhizopus arrhizus]|nr:hypothetical protein G6F65_021842 [Rhizopus arrhizus]
MTYLLLAVLHVPAIDIHGNALSLEYWEHWFTPAHALGGWSARLRQREALDAMRNLVEAPAAAGQAHVGQPAVEAPKSQINEALHAMPKAARQAAAADQISLF